MATVPTVQVWSIGQFVTSSQMNAGIGNVLSWLLNPPRATVYRSSGQSFSSGSVALVNWTTELVDTDTMWASGHPSRLVFQTAGRFLVEALAHFNGFASGAGYLSLGVNTAGAPPSGASKLQELTLPTAGTGFYLSLPLTFTYTFNAGDYIEMFLNQTSGGAVTAFPGGAYFDGHLGASWVATS